jgi:hypothetical protein
MAKRLTRLKRSKESTRTDAIPQTMRAAAIDRFGEPGVLKIY